MTLTEHICERRLTTRMTPNREIFGTSFLHVNEWIEKSLYLHCSTFNSAISVKICSFEVFNSALIAKFKVQSANFNSVIFAPTKKLSSMSEQQLSWNDIFMLGSEIDTTALKLEYNKISKIDDRPFFKSYSIYLQLFNGLF